MPHAIRLYLRLVYTLSGFRLAALFCIFYCTHSAYADSSTRRIHVTEADGIYTIQVSQEIDVDTLYVKKIYVDGGPTLKRIRPRAMGRASRILKRTSHITVVLDEQ